LASTLLFSNKKDFVSSGKGISVSATIGIVFVTVSQGKPILFTFNCVVPHSKESWKYVFDKFEVPYYEKDLSDLVSIRGKAIHSGTYGNIPYLLEKSEVLLCLLVTV